MQHKPPFVINANEIIKEPKEYEIDESPDELDLSDELARFDERITGRIRWTWVDRQAVATGRLEAHALVPCVRCLDDTPVDVTTDFRIAFTNEPPPETIEVVLGEEDEEGLTYFEGDVLDARPEIREILLVETPELPLCAVECKGLCPRCGANLNEGPCGCPPEAPGEEVGAKSVWKQQIEKLRDKIE